MDMIGRNKLATDTALLTGAGIVMRLIGMAWQVWLAGRIGQAGIGLFGLITSVGFLFLTVAISGIRFAATRLIAEEAGSGRPGSIGASVHRCLAYAAFFSVAAGAVLYLMAERMGFLWIGDARTVLSLRLYALSLPAAGLSSVLAGYFTAVGRVWKTAAEQLLEQLFRIALVAFLLSRTAAADLERCCAAVVGAGALGDYAGLFALSVLYLFDRRAHREPGTKGPALTPRLLRIALPLAASAYARSALNTVRQLLVPRGLRSAGLSADAALAGYGVIGGMALPVLIFPSCLLSSLAELLVPALTGEQMAGRRREIRRMVGSLIHKTFLFSLGAAVFFYFTADALGWLIYRDAEAGRYIRVLSPMVPFLYTDIVTDGCLKGLGEMMRSMAYNIAEAALGLLLVWTLLPSTALAGYIATLYACEVFNFILSLRRLWVVTREAEKIPGRA